MTTILKALQERERRDSHFVRESISPTPVGRRPRWGLLGVSLVALVGATIGVASLMRGRTAPSAGSRDLSTAEHRSVVAPPEPAVQKVAPSEPAVQKVAPPELAIRKVARPEPAVQKVAPPEPRPAAPQTSSAKDEPPTGDAAKPQSAAAPSARQPATPKENAAASQAKASRKAAPREPAAAKYAAVRSQPDVELKAINYAENSSDSTATLRINGGRALTLREGDAISGVEVQLILPDTVYLHYNGNVFTISLVR